MAVEVTVDSPLGKALQDVVHPKLVEVGWSTSLQDTTLSEYIIMMLDDGKSQEQIASEISKDLLDLGPNDQIAVDFSRWLFEQVDLLNAQLNGGDSSGAATGLVAGGIAQQDMGMAQDGVATAADAEMDDTASQEASIPTGPKSMRNGNGKPREKRILGQLNKAMERQSDAALHRVRGGGAGAGRINAHASRDPPKGPRSQQMQRNLAVQNGRMQQNMGMDAMNAMGAMGAIGGGLPGGAFNFQQGMMMPADQQMRMFSMLEQHARMMAEFAGQPGAANNNNNINNTGVNQKQGQRSGRSLFDRVDGKNQRHGRPQTRPMGQASQDTSMGEDGAAPAAGDDHGDGNDEQAQKDPSQTVCRFNLSCTKPDCAFAHQSPAAPVGTSIDLNDECTFGAACKNHKCVARHPSPAKKFAHQAEQDCMFGPNCTKFPNCPFRHATMPPCRNGGDCSVLDCKYFHSKVMCKFNPCLNPNCTYKHGEGQKRGSFGDKVWKAEDDKEHVSERKFVADENGEEEFIRPGAGETELDTSVIT